MADLILVASSDEQIIQITERTLRADNVEVLAARDGLQALDLALDRSPTAILISVELAHVDGVEVARALRALDPTEHVPIIFLAENEAEAKNIEREGLPFVEFIVAPYESERIKNEVASTLRSVKRIAEMRPYEPNGSPSSINDPLTHVFQRRYVVHRLAYEAARSARYKSPLSVLLVDIDNLSEINTEHGMLTGDSVLIETAQILYKALRRTDIIGRYNQQDFILVLPETPEENALRLGDRLHRAVAAAKYLNGKMNLRVTVSIGIAGSNGSDLAENLSLIGRAASALENAKQAGKNRVEKG
jgi:two-component system, cell cycle response regulator